MENKTIPIFRVIEVPDNLEYWTLDPEHAPFIKSINTVYLQETSTEWYMASSTPGFCAEPLYSTVDFQNEPSEAIMEAIHDYVEGAFNESDQDAVYFTHISESAKSVPITLSELEINEFLENPDRDQAIAIMWEVMIEDCRANHRI